MIVSLRDGTSVTLDLTCKLDVARWRQLQAHPDLISSVAIQTSNAVYHFPTPRRFRRVLLEAESVEHRNGSGKVVGEALTVYADDVRARLFVHTGDNRVAKIELVKSGLPVYLRGQP